MKKKTAVEILLVRAELTGIPEKRLLISRNLGSVDLIWPKTGSAKKSAAREMVFHKGVADFTGEPWAKRCIYREEIEDHCGIAVTITEPVSIQKLRRFLQLTAKAALKYGADVAGKAAIGYSDIASAPIDVLAQLVGEKEAPKAIAQGVIDFEALPGEGEEVTVEVELRRPLLLGKSVGRLVLLVRG